MPSLNIELLQDGDLEALARSSELADALLGIKHLELRGSPLRDHTLTDLMQRIDTAPQVRRTIATICGRRGTPHDRALLAAALADRDALVVRNAAKSMGRVGSEVELKLLEALPRHAGETQAAIDFAKSLVSYRHRLGRYRLAVPPPNALLHADGAVDVAVEDETRRREAVAEAALHQPWLQLSPSGGVLLECQGARVLVAFTKPFADADALRSLASRDAQPIVILQTGLSNQRFAVAQFILTHPHEGAVALLGTRPGGAPTYAGTARLDGDEITFSLRSIATRYAAAIEFAGSCTLKTSMLQLTRHKSSRQVADPSLPARRPQLTNAG